MTARSLRAAAARPTHTGSATTFWAEVPPSSKRRCPWAPDAVPSFIETLSHKKPKWCVLLWEGCRAPGCPPITARNPISGALESNARSWTFATPSIRGARKLGGLNPQVSIKTAVMLFCAFGIVICLTGCGGASGASNVARVAHCLRVDTVERYLGQTRTDCSDTALRAVGRSYQVHVACVHQNGNVYVCQDQTYDPVDGQRTNQMYKVTYDGRSLVAQPTG